MSGSLKNRLKNLDGVRVLAKTGHLNGISNLAGYVERAGKDPIVFSVVVQGASVDPKIRRQLIDDILKLLAKP